MTQIQIRQMPLTASSNTQRVVGSWFPSGYYGHFRAKSRAELSNHFRQLARPNPPKRFFDRQNTEPTSHLFSQHDNRPKFENDPLVRGTEPGFGKRKTETNARGDFDPLFISWVPKNVDRKKYIDASKITSYADNYNRYSTSSQILSDTQSMNASSPSSEISVYSSTYKHGQPDNHQSKQIRKETFQRFLSSRSRRAQLQLDEESTSVASCLVWNNTKKSDDTTMNIFVPVTLQPRITSTMKQQEAYHSESMPTFITTERLPTATTTLREHCNVKVTPLVRTATSFGQTHTNSLECLISKYM